MGSSRNGYDAGLLHRLYQRDEVICKGDTNQMTGKGSKRRSETKQDRANIENSKLWKNIEKKKQNNKGSK